MVTFVSIVVLFSIDVSVSTKSFITAKKIMLKLVKLPKLVKLQILWQNVALQSFKILSTANYEHARNYGLLLIFTS